MFDLSIEFLKLPFEIFMAIPLWIKIVFIPFGLVIFWKTFQIMIGLIRDDFGGSSYSSGEVADMTNQLIQDPKKRAIQKIETAKVIPESIIARERKFVSEFSRMNFPDVEKVFNNLKKEYDGINLLFFNNALRSNNLVNIDRIKKLSDEIYAQGLSLLAPILDLKQQLAITNIEELQQENDELISELENCGPKLKAMVEERLEKNTKSLKAVKGYRDRIDEHFCQVKLCRESIREIRLELPEILNHKSNDELDKVMLELKTRVEFAQRVRNEYAKQGI